MRETLKCTGRFKHGVVCPSVKAREFSIRGCANSLGPRSSVRRNSTETNLSRLQDVSKKKKIKSMPLKVDARRFACCKVYSFKNYSTASINSHQLQVASKAVTSSKVPKTSRRDLTVDDAFYRPIDAGSTERLIPRSYRAFQKKKKRSDPRR